MYQVVLKRVIWCLAVVPLAFLFSSRSDLVGFDVQCEISMCVVQCAVRLVCITNQQSI